MEGEVGLGQVVQEAAEGANAGAPRRLGSTLPAVGTRGPVWGHQAECLGSQWLPQAPSPPPPACPGPRVPPEGG